MSKLPNMWIDYDVYGSPIAVDKTRLRYFPDSALYIPAARLRELVEKFVHEAYRHAPKEWLLKELEALITEDVK